MPPTAGFFTPQLKNDMKKRDQFSKAKIIPAQPGWYACDPLVSEDAKKCVGISYEPVIAWAIVESEEMQYGDIASIITLPIFVHGSPNHALTSVVSEDECSQLFYKDPDGCFSRFGELLGSAPAAEARVIEIYSRLFEKRNRG